MKKVNYSFLIFLLCSILGAGGAYSQTLLYGEGFSNSPPNMFLNTSGVGTNSGNNLWVVNSSFTGNASYPNTTAQTNTVAGTIANPGGNYLHIHDSSAVVNNANFTASTSSDRFAITDAICTIGYTGVSFSFFWLAQGTANNHGEVYYRTNGGAWTQLGGAFNNQTNWRYQTFTNAAFNNVNSLEFGFRWVNNGSGTNTLPFSIDDILVSGTLNVTPTITITSVPASVCQGLNLTFGYTISPALCAGDYSISLLNAGGGTTLSWQVNNLTQTTGSFTLNIPTTVPAGTCYRIRMARVSGSNPPKPPFFTGTSSGCIPIIACPNTITTLQPAVTIGSTPGAGDSVCVGSVIDIPFWSTGTFNNGNIYTAWLSDSAGNFGNPASQILGSRPDRSTYDPAVVPSPGSVSGLVPSTPPGCNYYIRIVSSNPNSVGTTWGPFCIKNCDIESNIRQDVAFCISTLKGDTQLVNIDINVPPRNVSYGANNSFELEVLDMMTFASLYKGPALGSVVATISTGMTMIIPDLNALRALGLDAGSYYLRVVSTNPALNGTVIRLTIGAPYVDSPLTIVATDTVMCQGGAVFFNVNRFRPPQFNNKSEYQWFLGINGAVPTPFPAPAPSPQFSLGVRFNSTGFFTVSVQETNFGCIGPMAPDVTVAVTTVPIVSLGASTQSVCRGDTITYRVPFLPSTRYDWNMTGGTITDTSNNEIKIVINGTTPARLKLTATNFCGNAADSVRIIPYDYPVIDLGPDINLCAGEDTLLDMNNTTASFWLWPGASQINALQPIPNSPRANLIGLPDTTEIIAYAGFRLPGNPSPGGANQCISFDTIMVNVAPLPIANAGPDTFVCNFAGVQLNGGEGIFNEYTWLNSEGTLNDTNIRRPFANPAGEITYALRVVEPISGCVDTDSITIKVSSLIQEDPKLYKICDGEQIELFVTDPSVDFEWTTGETTNSIIVDEGGTYGVKVSDTIGCEIINEHILDVTLPLFPNTKYDSTIFCIGEIDTLFANPEARRFYWSTGQSSPSIEVNADGNYLVQLWDMNGCWSVDTFPVFVRNDCKLIFYVPNTFSPNKDGLNETIGPITYNIDEYDFVIYDRWGNLMHETSTFERWDGKSPNGLEAPIGVYAWKILYTDLENQPQVEVGTINLIR